MDPGRLSRRARARISREKTLGQMVEDLLGRAFAGSASALVAHLLDQSHPTQDELEEIRKTIDEHLKQGDRE